MTTTDQTVPDAAVKIAFRVFRSAGPTAQRLADEIVTALTRAGWLHDPARVAALEAVAEAAREVRVSGAAQWLDAPLAALDALPLGTR